MTLKELIRMCPVIVVDNCENVIKQNIDSDIDVVYYWYHHMLPDSLRDGIQFVIENGLYADFIELCDALNTDEICYLPKEASIYVDGTYIGTLLIFNGISFRMITYSEYECG